MNKSIAYCTLGCKVNQYDTDTMRALLEKTGFITVPFSEKADVYIINTCTVTHVGDRKSRQMIAKAHRQNENAKIIVCGCYAQVSPDEVVKLNGVTRVLGTNDRSKIVEVVNGCFDNELLFENTTVSYNEMFFEELSAEPSDKTRAYLKIQDGCNRFCSYCMIPYARGRVQSRSVESVKRELSKLEKDGFSEIVLTGIHVMSYGADFPDKKTDISDIIKISSEYKGIKRIRLGSLEPEFVTDKFIETVSSLNICRQFHMSLQSGADSVLQRMNRKYSANEYKNAVIKLRDNMPDCAITTDIIAGFPGETDNEHNETLAFIDDIRFSRIHAFPYSKRRGTPAAKMPNQISPEIKEKRTSEIISLGNKYMNLFAEEKVGTVQEVLIEEVDKKTGLYRGYTDTYIDVQLKNINENSQIGKICQCEMISACNGTLIGIIIK